MPLVGDRVRLAPRPHRSLRRPLRGRLSTSAPAHAPATRGRGPVRPATGARVELLDEGGGLQQALRRGWLLCRREATQKPRGAVPPARRRCMRTSSSAVTTVGQKATVPLESSASAARSAAASVSDSDEKSVPSHPFTCARQSTHAAGRVQRQRRTHTPRERGRAKERWARLREGSASVPVLSLIHI